MKTLILVLELAVILVASLPLNFQRRQESPDATAIEYGLDKAHTPLEKRRVRTESLFQPNPDIVSIEYSVVKSTKERREPITIEYNGVIKTRSPQDGTAHADGRRATLENKARSPQDGTVHGDAWDDAPTTFENKERSPQSGIAMGNNGVDSIGNVDSRRRNGASNSENNLKPRQNGIAMGNNIVDNVGSVDSRSNG